jgi:hypothetical protein
VVLALRTSHLIVFPAELTVGPHSSGPRHPGHLFLWPLPWDALVPGSSTVTKASILHAGLWSGYLTAHASAPALSTPRSPNTCQALDPLSLDGLPLAQSHPGLLLLPSLFQTLSSTWEDAFRPPGCPQVSSTFLFTVLLASGASPVTLVKHSTAPPGDSLHPPPWQVSSGATGALRRDCGTFPPSWLET